MVENFDIIIEKEKNYYNGKIIIYFLKIIIKKNLVTFHTNMLFNLGAVGQFNLFLLIR